MTNVKELKEDGSGGTRASSKKTILTKIVCRRLPPSLDQETFLELVTPLPEYNYFRFEVPNPEDGIISFCRAYFNFLHQEDVFNFTERFDGYVFLDKQGNEYPAIVEFAPYQKIPKSTLDQQQREDSKCNTLETDKEYLAFCEAYENKENESGAHPTPEQYLEELENREKNKETSTPLLEFLAQRKIKMGKFREKKSRRQREAKQLEKAGWRDKGGSSGGVGGEASADHPAEELPERSNKKKKEDRRSRREKKQLQIGEGGSSKETEGRRKEERNSKDEPRKRNEDKFKEDGGGDVPSSSNKRKSDRRRGSRKNHKDNTENFHSVTILKKDDFPAIGASPQKEPESKPPPPSKSKKVGDRIKNKERPAIEIYRPGMGKFSSQTIRESRHKEQPEEEDESSGRTRRENNKSKVYYRSSHRRNETNAE
eukprot:TRINITY_DN593_c0_g1_i2.p1 TRINITY_DN593_c0_g1~~TRINITY_DN593_c0_g1_i2.p1  ORF type:complete len:426 (+),score=143.56 TRINITY_DN593_c0_g1_i2:78-1355(+)